jgi:hypothetical protein
VKGGTCVSELFFFFFPYNLENIYLIFFKFYDFVSLIIVLLNKKYCIISIIRVIRNIKKEKFISGQVMAMVSSSPHIRGEHMSNIQYIHISYTATILCLNGFLDKVMSSNQDAIFFLYQKLVLTLEILLFLIFSVLKKNVYRNAKRWEWN